MLCYNQYESWVWRKLCLAPHYRGRSTSSTCLRRSVRDESRPPIPPLNCLCIGRSGRTHWRHRTCARTMLAPIKPEAQHQESLAFALCFGTRALRVRSSCSLACPSLLYLYWQPWSMLRAPVPNVQVRSIHATGGRRGANVKSETYRPT